MGLYQVGVRMLKIKNILKDLSLWVYEEYGT